MLQLSDADAAHGVCALESSSSIVPSVDKSFFYTRAWQLRFNHMYVHSPCTIIAVLPLFYLICGHVPGYHACNIKKLGGSGDEANVGMIMT